MCAASLSARPTSDPICPLVINFIDLPLHPAPTAPLSTPFPPCVCSALERLQPRVVSFEEPVTLIRESLAEQWEREEAWSKAAGVLAGIDLDSGGRGEEAYRHVHDGTLPRVVLEHRDHNQPSPPPLSPPPQAREQWMPPTSCPRASRSPCCTWRTTTRSALRCLSRRRPASSAAARCEDGWGGRAGS